VGGVRSSDGRFSDLGRFALGIGLPRDRHPEERAVLDRLTRTLHDQLLEARELATENDLRALLQKAASKRAGVITLLDMQNRKIDGVSYTREQAAREGWTLVF
jgi:hypothetical protein